MQMNCRQNACLTVAVSSNVGHLRSNNEDNFLIGKKWNRAFSDDISEEVRKEKPLNEWLCIGVFDGMGGGERGELASALAAQEFRSSFLSVAPNTSKQEIENLARRAILAANHRIIEENRLHSVLGTTGTVLCTDGEQFKVFHIGDSRAYLFRAGVLQQLTVDQTLAALKIKVGYYTENAPEAEIDKHKLTEYIGKDPTSEGLSSQESDWISLSADDKLLLCSDGLYDMCTNGEISEILSEKLTPSGYADKLIAAALQNGGLDNITCVVLENQNNDSGKRDDNHVNQ